MTRSTKLSSLMAASAMFVCLMASGCSEGDNTPANVNYDPSSGKLDVVIGLNTESLTAKADVPGDSDNYVLSLYDKEGKLVRDITFTKEGAGDTKIYTDVSETERVLSVEVTKEDIAADIDRLMVVVNKGEEGLGLLTETEGIELAAGKTCLVDFTEDDAPAFVSAADALKNTKLNVTTDPLANEEGIVAIAIDGKITVDGSLEYVADDKTFIVDENVGEDLTLTPDVETEAISIEKNVITGISASGEVTITPSILGETEAETITGDAFKMVVEGAVMVVDLTDLYLLPTGYAVSEDATAILDAEGVAVEDLSTVSADTTLNLGETPNPKSYEFVVIGKYSDDTFKAVKGAVLAVDDTTYADVEDKTVTAKAEGTVHVVANATKLDGTTNVDSNSAEVTIEA